MNCHNKGEYGPCSKPPVKELHTIYGTYKMCNDCAGKMPKQYLSKLMIDRKE